jgi:thiamine transport system ATP-binding protein
MGTSGSGAVSGSVPVSGLAVRSAVVRYDDDGAGRGGRGRRGEAQTAVDGVDLDVADGEVLALLGPSGCGKSSLLRAVAGLEPLAGGSVAFDGHDLAGVPAHRRGFGLLFQDGQLFAHRSVARNVSYGLEVARVPRAEQATRVRELLDAVGLAGFGDRDVSTLSGGEQQRVALARALAPRPRLLLLDEPFSALDRALRERLAVDVRDVLRATGTTAIFVTHDHDEANTVADRIAVMSTGRLQQVAAPQQLWRAPATREVAEFLGYQAFVPADGGWLAVGLTGLRIAGPGDDGARTWEGRVAGTAFRRGRVEVTVVVDLGGGPQRTVMLLGSGASEPMPGDTVTVLLDPAGTALVPR